MEEPKSGQRYRHFRGTNQYEIIAVARDVDSPESKSVIYKSLYDCAFPMGTIWRRLLEDFVGFKTLGDGTKVKRFTLIE